MMPDLAKYLTVSHASKLVSLVVVLISSGAYGANTVAISPLQVWVSPHAVPLDSNGASTAGTRMLLRDNQAWVDPDGAITLYWHDATKVLTPDGSRRSPILR